jgi:hypothetical protein
MVFLGQRQFEVDDPDPEPHYRKHIFLLWTGWWRKWNVDLDMMKASQFSRVLQPAILRLLIEAYKVDHNGSLNSQIDVCKLLIAKAIVKPTEMLDIVSQATSRVSRSETSSTIGFDCPSCSCQPFYRTLLFQHANY